MYVFACLQPAEYCDANFAPRYKDDNQTLKFNKGTTTLGFIFQGGVLISVDSRATQGPYIGPFRHIPIQLIHDIYILAKPDGFLFVCFQLRKQWRR